MMNEHFLFTLLLPSMLLAQSPPTITLPTPDTTGGMPIMKAFALRASERVFDTTALPIQKLSNLLWAANGINRPGERKRTAPSALNAQDIDIYVFLSNGVYLYDANQHVLIGVVEGDHRQLFSRSPGSDPIPPVLCLLVSDISRFRFGVDSARRVWAAMDAGIVSQNISLYCASAGLATRPRAMMNHQKVRELLHLKDTHIPMLNLPISQKLGREQPK